MVINNYINLVVHMMALFHSQFVEHQAWNQWA